VKRFNILVIPGYKLFPIDSGGAHHQLVFLSRQQEQHSIDLMVTPQNLAAGSIDDFKKKFPDINLILVGYNKRTVISKWGHFFKKQYRKILKKFPYHFKKIKELHNLIPKDHDLIGEIKKIAQNKQYEIIQVEHTVNMGLIEVLPATAVRIFVHHEISHTRIHSDLLTKGHSRVDADRISNIAEGIEINWLNRYNGIITLSIDDKVLLRQKGVNTPVQVARPFCYFDEELEKIYEPLPQPTLVFAGGETHFPNKEGLSWFLEEVNPLFERNRNDVRLLVTGEWTEEFKKKYSANPNIRFTGYVDDLKTIFKKAIMIIPIRIGSGIRVKAISALGNGVPIITTSFAVTGIPGLRHNENVILADTKELFTKSITDLMDSFELRKKISEGGFELARAEYGNALFIEERNMFYEELFNAKNRS
jgi:glycosyltransferase involved in cell wall biosynthesis